MPALIGDDGALAIDRLANRVHHAADELLAYGHIDDATRAAYDIALSDVAVVAEDDDADVVLLEVEGDPKDAVFKLQHLARQAIAQAIGTRDAVAHLEDAPDPNLSNSFLYPRSSCSSTE